MVTRTECDRAGERADAAVRAAKLSAAALPGTMLTLSQRRDLPPAPTQDPDVDLRAGAAGGRHVQKFADTDANIRDMRGYPQGTA
jgi:hypothetical protein